MNANASNTQEDNRSIQRIIFEKAQFGAVPTGFKVTDDDRWHPVAWTQHPDLMTIGFSDGSFVHVMPANHFKDKVSTEPAHRFDKLRQSDVDRSVDDFIMERTYPTPSDDSKVDADRYIIKGHPDNAQAEVSNLTGSTGFSPQTEEALDDLTVAMTTGATQDVGAVESPGIAGSLLRPATSPFRPTPLDEEQAKTVDEIAAKFAPRSTGKPEGFA